MKIITKLALEVIVFIAMYYGFFEICYTKTHYRYKVLSVVFVLGCVLYSVGLL